jgi:hypothetical protein
MTPAIFDTADGRAIYRLVAAILVQAIQDIRGSSATKRADAIRWINNREDRQFSFTFCCRILNRSPQQVRQWLLTQRPSRRLYVRVAAAHDTIYAQGASAGLN